MGICGLTDFLRKKFPTSFKDINIKDLRYKKIAVDTSLYLYKYKVINNEHWLDCFISLICCLRKNDVHPVFIFDTSAPIEKIEEQKRRRKEVQDRRDKIEIIRILVQSYYKDGVIDPILQEFYDKKNKNTDKEKISLLKKLHQKDVSLTKKFDINFIEEEIRKIDAQNISISSDDIINLKNLFDIMGVQYYQAIEEAEQTCAYLCHWKLVDGVLTEDSDVIAYGVDLFISKINSFSGQCTLIETPNLLDKLEFTREQLLDFCIMLQCDYNTRIPKIGPVSSYKLLKEYGNLDDLKEKTDMDLTSLNYERCRQLFGRIDNDDKFCIRYSCQPDYNELGQFLYDNDCQITMNRVKKDCGFVEIN